MVKNTKDTVAHLGPDMCTLFGSLV